MKKQIIALIALVFFVSFAKYKESQKLELKSVNTFKSAVAGSTIAIQFMVNTTKNIPYLYCSTSYGSTLISPSIKKDTLSYYLPKEFNTKIGTVFWKLQYRDSIHANTFQIVSPNEVTTIKNYIEATFLEAGEKDFVMLVTVPTDKYDNPKPDSTKVILKQNYQNQVKTEVLTLKNGAAYKNLYAQKKTGKTIIFTSCLGTPSSENTYNTVASYPEPFTIKAIQPHKFADGNQTTLFETSIIKDKFGNIITDGTQVQFFIKQLDNSVLQTSGTTINGVAKATILHPETAATWSVVASIYGMAKSAELILNYDAVVHDIPVAFSKSNRVVVVGPITSYMNQIIPDGLSVELQVSTSAKEISKRKKTTKNGYVTFYLPEDFFPTGIYNLKVNTAGVTHSVSNLKL